MLCLVTLWTELDNISLCRVLNLPFPFHLAQIQKEFMFLATAGCCPLSLVLLLYLSRSICFVNCANALSPLCSQSHMHAVL